MSDNNAKEGNSCFDGSTDKKIVFHFVDQDLTALKEAKIDSETSVLATDEDGNPITIRFRVTRNTHLSSACQWIYGKVLDVPEELYYQIELKFHNETPEWATIEAFLQAPPVSFKIK